MKEKKLLKTGALWCLVFAMVFLFRGTALARTTGSVKLQLPQKEAEGIELTLYQVAELENEGYIFCKEFADIGLVITNLNDAAQAQEMADKFADYALEKELEGQTGKVGEDGTLCFTELPLGLYLAVQTDGQKLLKVQSSFVPVPHVAEAQAEPVYDVVISLKYTFPGGAVIATKVDENGRTLGQAHFTLQRKTYLGNGETVPDGAETERDKEGIFYWKEYQADLVSNENGQIVLAGLPKGVYRFVETKAPSGFVRLGQPQEFIVESAGEVVEDGGIYKEGSGSVAKLAIVNRATVLKINKVDTMGNPVSGAKLVIKDADGKVIVDEKGEAAYAFTTASQPYELKGLPAGNYYLSEIQAPEGYKAAQDVRFTLSDAEGAVNEVVMVDEAVGPDEPQSEPQTESETETEGFGGSKTPGGNSGGGSPKGNTGSSGSSVKTGDDTPIMLYTGLLAAAALVIATLVWRKVKKSK